MWLTLPFYDFCGFQTVAVNTKVGINCSFLHLYIIGTVRPLWTCYGADTTVENYVFSSSYTTYHVPQNVFVVYS